MSESFREEINEAIGAHGAWKQRLRTAAMKQETNLPVEDICSDDKCRFGKWLYGLPVDQRKDGRAEKVRELHAQFHKTAGNVALLIRDGKADAALSEIESGAFVDIARYCRANSRPGKCPCCDVNRLLLVA